MFSLSKESEKELSQGVLTLIDTFLKSQDKVSQKSLGLMTPKQLKEELDIDPVSYTHLSVASND